MEDKMQLRHWLSLTGLTLCTFIFNTSEFIPIGLLSDIQKDFHLTEVTAGLLISVYAWVVMLLSLPLMILVSKMELRKLMLWLIGLFAAFQAMSFFSTSYAMLMASRIGVACVHSIFWAIVSPIAVRITPPSHRSLALSMVVTGSSIAMILGMPIGRIIGLHVGWRMTFLSIGIFAFCTLFYVAVTLPKVPSRGGFSPRKLPALLHDRALVGIFVFTLLVSTAYYVSYSYIEPFLKQTGGMGDQLVTAALMIFGGAGFLGSVAFSRYYNRNRFVFVAATVAGLALTMGLLLPSTFNVVVCIVVCSLMGLSATAYNVAMQSNLIYVTTPESTAVAMAIFSGIFNLGIGSGAFIGGNICVHSTIGYIGFAGAAIALVALLYWTLHLGRIVNTRFNA